MNNIFKEAKFGDKFLTRDGRIAIYAMKSYLDGKLANWCLVEKTSFTWAYNDNGVVSSEIDHQFDIVSRYQEPSLQNNVNEEKLDKLAWYDTYPGNDDYHCFIQYDVKIKKVTEQII